MILLLSTVGEGERGRGAHLCTVPRHTHRGHSYVYKKDLGTERLELCRAACAGLANCDAFHVKARHTYCALVGEGITRADEARAETASTGTVGAWKYVELGGTGAVTQALATGEPGFQCWRKSVKAGMCNFSPAC